jgi:hypothetical protein
MSTLLAASTYACTFSRDDLHSCAKTFGALVDVCVGVNGRNELRDSFQGVILGLFVGH